ncbi:tetratricopeptide repeat protein [Gammaproteobacteria bacterium]|nr:tetratricopeptide repeat protein [Gammaproteobacteria bacterium]
MTETKLAVILHADVVSSTELVQLNETLAHERIQDTFRRLSEIISHHNGIAHEIRGDALVAEFSKASDAVSAAIAFQATNTAHSEEVADEIRPVVRVGIAMGEVVIAENIVTGEGVVLAQRLEQLTKPGGICIQGAVYETVPKRLPFDYESMGKKTLKGFAEPVRAYSVLLKAGEDIPVPEPGNLQEASPIQLSEKPSIAVLPFTNMNGDPEQEYFSDGITEDVITGLSKNPDILVISRNSTFTFKDKSVQVRDVGEALGAQYVMEGSVRKAGQRVRVTAQLIDAKTDHHLWSERYDRDLDDIFAVQDEVVGSILYALTGAIDGVLEKSVRQRRAEHSTTNMTAYDCYLQGRDHFYHHGNAGFEAAEALYEKAITLDSGFARAYSALAWLHFIRFKLFRTHTFEDIRQTALDLALQSVQLDLNDYRAHWVLGSVYMHDGKHAQSLAEFDRALEINPNDAGLLAFSGQVLIYWGRMDEALERFQRAIRLNPNCPDWYYWVLGMAYFHLGDYEEALRTLQRMSAPQHGRRMLAATYAQLDRLEEARAEAKEYLKVTPNFSIAVWAKSEPYTDPNELQRYVNGLRKAGLPE